MTNRPWKCQKGKDQRSPLVHSRNLAGHCQISYREGLGMSPCIMGLITQDPYILNKHIVLYKILKFRVNWANIKQDTAIQKLNKCMDCRTLVRKKSLHFLSQFWSFSMAVSCLVLAQ